MTWKRTVHFSRLLEGDKLQFLCSSLLPYTNIWWLDFLNSQSAVSKSSPEFHGGERRPREGIHDIQWQCWHLLYILVLVLLWQLCRPMYICECVVDCLNIVVGKILLSWGETTCAIPLTQSSDISFMHLDKPDLSEIARRMIGHHDWMSVYGLHRGRVVCSVLLYNHSIADVDTKDGGEHNEEADIHLRAT